MSSVKHYSFSRVWIAAFVLLLVMGTRATFGLFMLPMGLSLSWEREVFSLAFALQNIIWGVGAIVAGMAADRWGAGRTIAISALFYVLGLLGMYLSSSELVFYLSAGVLIGIGQAGTTFAVLFPLVARAVPPDRRSAMMGVVGAGGSLGQFFVPPMTQFLLDSNDWEFSLLALSLIIACIIPLSMCLRGRSEADPNEVQLSMGQAIGQALKHPSYHFLFWSYAVCGFHTAFITLHLPAYIQDSGLNAHHGTTAIALIGLFNVFGSIWAGKLGGIMSKKKLLAIMYGARAIGVLFLLSMPFSTTTLYIFAGFMGIFWLGTVPLTNGLVGQIYGMRFAATLSGILFLGHQIGSFIGAYMGGKIYTVFNSYDVMWWFSVALAILAALLCLPVQEVALNVKPQRA